MRHRVCGVGSCGSSAILVQPTHTMLAGRCACCCAVHALVVGLCGMRIAAVVLLGKGHGHVEHAPTHDVAWFAKPPNVSYVVHFGWM